MKQTCLTAMGLKKNQNNTNFEKYCQKQSNTSGT